ncbi:MAG: hypothetical protein AAF787_03795 [Chloroflexota bacterium]
MSYPYRYASGIEIIGATASAIFNHTQSNEVMDSLREHGVDHLQPDAYYPVDRFIDVFADWYRTGDNLMMNLVSVGMAVIENAELPPDVEDWPLMQQLALPKILHEMSHRPAQPGQIDMEIVSDAHIIFTENTVWPDDVIYGLIYGVAQHFLARGYHFYAEYDETVPRMEDGGDQTVIHLHIEPR